MGILLQDSKPEVINNLPTSSAYMNKERGEIIEASNNVIGRKRKIKYWMRQPSLHSFL